MTKKTKTQTNKKQLTKTQKSSFDKLLTAKDPAQYIDFMVKSRLPKGLKIMATKAWLKKHPKYNLDDIKYARNRHPYWKEKKAINAGERTRNRMIKYNYSNGRAKWTPNKIGKFVDLQKQGKLIDREMAKKLKTSIASIQMLRRRWNIVQKFNLQRIRKERMVYFIGLDEKKLRHMRDHQVY